MPTLNWIGKEAVVEHHQEVGFRRLRCDPALSVGDNLLALQALLPQAVQFSFDRIYRIHGMGKVQTDGQKPCPSC